MANGPPDVTAGTVATWQQREILRRVLNDDARVLQTHDRFDAIHRRQRGRAIGVPTRHMTTETPLERDIEVAREQDRTRLRELDEKHAAARGMPRRLENVHRAVAEDVEVAVDELLVGTRVTAEQLRCHADVRRVRERPGQLVTVENPRRTREEIRIAHMVEMHVGERDVIDVLRLEAEVRQLID